MNHIGWPGVLFAVAIILIIVAGGVYYFHELIECNKVGGALVKGAFGYACVAAAK